MRRFLAVVLYLLSCAVAQAVVLPPGRYPFRSYGVESGLGSLSAMSLAQDATGYLWVATQDGVYRYDGTRFRRFGMEDGLPSASVTSIVTGPRGEVWAATVTGVARFDGERFATVTGLPRGSADAISLDRTGRLWVATAEGLFVETHARRFARLAAWEGEASGVWSDPRSGDLWVSALGVVARRNGTSWERWTLTPRERIDNVVVDARGRVWARSGNHLWSRGADEATFRDESAALPATSNNGYLCLDARGDLWVPTDRGLAIHDATGWRILGAEEGLPTDWARHVIEDREGSIWVASLGVHRMLGRGELVSYKRAGGLPNEVTWAFLEDREGHLLAGTDLGLARASANGWSVVPGTEGVQIRAAIADGGVLWAGGSPATIIRIDGARVRRYGESEGVAARTIFTLLRARDGAIWAGTRGGGLLRKAPGEERFVRVNVPAGPANEDFRSVIEDRHGRIWAAGQHGLAAFDGNRWRRFRRADGLAHDHVAYLTETRAGELWIAYYEPFGVARVRLDRDTLHVIERRDTSTGLAANKIYFVGEDDRRRLWAGTGVGVSILGGGVVEHLDTTDGLAGDDTDANAFRADARGNVFIGTSSGFSHYVARSDPPRRKPPVVTLTEAQLGGAVIPVGTFTSFPASWQKRDFTAAFSALTFFKPGIVEYEVRLAGVDDEWRRVTEGRAHWSRLPHGDYRFEVRARLRPGEWSEPMGFGFAIRPAWWQTRWAHAGAVLLAALLIFLVYRARVAMLRRRNAELRALVEQRTRELAELSVTDALTGIKNRRYLQHCMPEYTASGELVLFLVDLDWFKEINDRHGHLAGDEALVAISNILGTQLRASDTLVRWGGEEFLCIARHASRAEAPLIAERIRAAVEAAELTIGEDTRVSLTCSIGFAAFPFLPEDRMRVSWEDVVDVADICLYAAKRMGRNAWVGVMTRACHDPATLVARMRTSMADVVSSGELEVLTSKPMAVRWPGAKKATA